MKYDPATIAIALEGFYVEVGLVSPTRVQLKPDASTCDRLATEIARAPIILKNNDDRLKELLEGIIINEGCLVPRYNVAHVFVRQLAQHSRFLEKFGH